jgi:hypothetical protein
MSLVISSFVMSARKRKASESEQQQLSRRETLYHVVDGLLKIFPSVLIALLIDYACAGMLPSFFVASLLIICFLSKK